MVPPYPANKEVRELFCDISVYIYEKTKIVDQEKAMSFKPRTKNNHTQEILGAILMLLAIAALLLG